MNSSFFAFSGRTGYCDWQLRPNAAHARTLRLDPS